MALIVATLLAALVGVYHLFALRALDRLSGQDGTRPNRTLSVAFLGLLAIHLSEILAFAGVYAGLLSTGRFGALEGTFDGTFNDLIYFSGMSFATLGYADIDARGPIRMVGMVQSLLGFMLITWSATFLFTVWEKAFRR
ncbi:ion channel [Palleronia abyssalis]|uniref:Potassium channel domain-containing protein n=1 Tax=Palleronia abyssalis TaxID=1501240 RepID=A0A2R8BY00_9RHOB|nr:ion channel [Palleronia abyssalis]SPJ24956.1 hypothetical protein PAA8504_02798 [Palleronia abyssalis]